MTEIIRLPFSSLNKLLITELELMDIRVEVQELPIPLKKLMLNAGFSEYLHEFFDDLNTSLTAEIKSELHKLTFQYKLLNLDYKNINLLLEDEVCFNRYRLHSYRNSFYENNQNYDLQKWRNFSRNKEKEALKSGLITVIWEHSLANRIFGAAAEPGDFGKNGSSGWKMFALANFILDYYFSKNTDELVRIAPYENFMVNGSIHAIGESLRKQVNLTALRNSIARRIGYELPKD